MKSAARNLIEKGLLMDVRLQCRKGLFHDCPAQFLLILWIKIRIAHGIDDFAARYDPVGAYHKGHGCDGTYMGRGDSGPLKLLGQRCTATRAGSSGGGQDNP